MYCPECKEERSGKFCHICGAKLVENRQVDAQINIGDGNAIKDLQFHHQVNNVSNVTNNIVERQKTAEELKREAEEQFAQFCKDVFEDGILTAEERNLLRNKQLELGLSDEKAGRFIEQFRKASNHRNRVLSANATIVLDHCERQVKNNDIKKLGSFLLRLKTLAENYDVEKVQFLYYMVLAAIKPEELIREYECDIIDKYWKTYWVAIAYHKIGKGEKSFEAIERLGVFSENNEDNCILLNAIELYNSDGPEVASVSFNSIIPESCSTLLGEVVQAMSVAISHKNTEDINKYKFYIDNIITFESLAEKEAKRRAEEEAKRRAAEEAKRKAEEEAKRRSEEEAKRRSEEEAKRRAAEEAKRRAEEEAKRRAAEEAKRRAAEEEKRRAAEEAKRRAERQSSGFDAKRCFAIGEEYFYGRKGKDISYKDAIEWYRKAAEQGDVDAQNKLGHCYYNGNGVSQSYVEAAKWYRKAAEQGDVNAQFNLGCCYYRVEAFEEATKWYRKAAEQGDAVAQRNLGFCYYNGNGVAQSYEEAVKWYRKAAEQGDVDAQNSLGDWYYNGNGVAQSYEEAVKWYRKATEQGYAVAQCNLGFCYEEGNGVAQSYEEAVKWYRKATEQGFAVAQCNLGDCYYKGNGVSQSYFEAAKWYRKAAEQGNVDAQNSLGNCYYNGNGVAQSYEEAAKWYRKAAEQGHDVAKLSLAVCEKKIPKGIWRLFKGG